MRHCWLCGANGSHDPLDRHHIFGGAYRDKSEKYGLVVDLCHEHCHIFGRYSVHQDAEVMRHLRQWGQRKAMREQNWSTEDFIREFGKNYLGSNKREGVEYEMPEEEFGYYESESYHCDGSPDEGP